MHMSCFAFLETDREIMLSRSSNALEGKLKEKSPPGAEYDVVRAMLCFTFWEIEDEIADLKILDELILSRL